MKYLVIPGLNTDDLFEVKQKAVLVNKKIPRLFVDIIDGLFADNITVGVEDLCEVEWGDTKLDLHLMVEEPSDFLEQAKTAGVSRVFGHIERMSNRDFFIKEAVNISLEPGLALDLYTPIEEIKDSELEEVNGVLLLSVKAGFSYQKHKDISRKIRDLRRRGFEGDLVIDGGVNEETIPSALRAGANQFSVTSAIWEDKDPIKKWRELMDTVKKEAG